MLISVAPLDRVRPLQVRVPSYLLQLISCIGGDSPTVGMEQTHLPLFNFHLPLFDIGLQSLAAFAFAHLD